MHFNKLYFKSPNEICHAVLRTSLKEHGWQWSSKKDLVYYTPLAMSGRADGELFCLNLNDKTVSIATKMELYLRIRFDFYCIKIIDDSLVIVGRDEEKRKEMEKVFEKIKKSIEAEYSAIWKELLEDDKK